MQIQIRMKTCQRIPQPHEHSTLATILSKTYAFVLLVVVLAPSLAMGRELRTNQTPGAKTTTAVISSAGSQSAPSNSTLHQSDSSNSSDDYKNRLKELSSLYEQD